MVTESEKPWAGWSKEKKQVGQRELGGKKLVRVASGGQLGSPLMCNGWCQAGC